MNDSVRDSTNDAIRDVMTPNPIAVPADTSVADTARVMRDQAIGDVLVTRDDVLLGIVTDRDLVVRALAEGIDPQTTVERFCSDKLHVVKADDKVGETVQLLRDKAIRRVPVVDDGQVVGIVSIGDLARERDPSSALADISSAPPNA